MSAKLGTRGRGNTVGMNGVGFKEQTYDLNNDDRVDDADSDIVFQVFLGNDTDPDHVRRSDLNGDQSVDVLDVQLHVNAVIEARARGWLGTR